MTEAVGSVSALADTHGVLPVLDAVLAELEVRAADLIVVCGDIPVGPQPPEVLDRLAGLGSVLLVRSNAHRDPVALARGKYRLTRKSGRLTGGRRPSSAQPR